ncbi:MAG: hypothetical protein ACOX4K_04370 [Bacillota bacterium]
MFQALSLPIMMVMAITPYPALFIVGFVIRSGLMNMASPLIDSYAMESIAPAERGTVTGLPALSETLCLLWGEELAPDLNIPAGE